MKFRAHKRLFRALGTIAPRKFGHSPISHQVKGDAGHSSSPMTHVATTGPGWGVPWLAPVGWLELGPAKEFTVRGETWLLY